MKYFIQLFITIVVPIVILLSLVQNAESVDKYHQEADKYWDQAEKLLKQGHYFEAAQLYERSVEAEKASSTPRVADLLAEFNRAAYCYYRIHQYDKALVYFEQALELARKFDEKGEISTSLNNIGEVYKAKGHYDKALTYFEQALRLARQLGNETNIAALLNNIGLISYMLGHYDKALDYFQQTVELDRKLGQDDRLSRHLSNVGAVYGVLGKYDGALDYYQQALKIARKLDQEADIATSLNNIGYLYYNWGQYDNALEYFEQALEFDRKLGNNMEIATRLSNIASVYRVWGQYDKALEYFEQALELNRKLGNDTEIASVLNKIGLVYSAWGQYDNALNYYEQALEVNRKLGIQSEMAAQFNNIGQVYHMRGHYDKALNYYQQALELSRRLGEEAKIAMYLHNIGEVYQAWGHYDNALDYYQQAVELDRKLGRKADIAAHLDQIGLIYKERGRYEKALDYHRQALEFARKSGEEARIVIYLNNIGGVYYAREHYDKALEYYEQSLKLARKLGEEVRIVIYLNNVGGVYNIWGQHDKALDYFQQALELARKLGQDADIVLCLNNIGAVYYNQQKYPEAISYFVESVELKEQLRKTATGDVRREYLASQIYTYQFLISCYIRTGDFAKAFQIIELGRAKRLAEQLAGTDEVSIPSLDHIQSKLPEDTGVLIYANTDWQNMVQVVITKEKITASEYSISESGQNVMNQEHSDVTTTSSETRGLNIGQKKPQKTGVTDVRKPFDLKTIIKAYRAQLLSPSPSRGLSLGAQKKPARDDELKDTPKRDLNTSLYSLLLGNVQKQLQEKTRLIIVPDGTLNFLPFETLIDDQGKYLVETYQISYAQSLGMLDLIGQRRYTPDRKPLLAFGGAIYDAPTYEAQMIENETQLAYLQKQIDDALSKGEPVGKLYAQLRGSGWSNLPGTLQEVKAIQQVMQGAEIVTGADVNEAVVKNLSAKGELANYKILHFATHGDADARISELSALVLSLSAFPSWEGSGVGSSDAGETPALPREEEDGFLRAGEIVDLTLKADFVSLSACETGLGKLYSGEGMVGLTQAFLLAGANGLSVSLWSVADESTAAFMVALYKLVEEQGLSYAEAITEVKRRFIAGDFGEKWKAPFYWAPFVYYGR